MRNIFNPTQAECLLNEEIKKMLDRLDDEKEACRVTVLALSLTSGLLALVLVFAIIYTLR